MRTYAVVGTGSRSGMYVGALAGPYADVGRLVALCDPNPVRLDNRRHLAGNPDLRGYGPADFERMISEQRPDAVIVTSPDFTHDRYICAALAAGVNVITEKPLTTDAERLRRIVAAVAASSADLTVTFNYRYSPRNSVVRELITSGVIGSVTSVHFEWQLDTAHGADYFRRWHREKANSGGLAVHKSSHHFDLVNWWLADVPTTVYAHGGLKFYGAANAAARGLGPRAPLSRDSDSADPFRLDLAADPNLRSLYLEAEGADGYHRDLDVFGEGITIEDSLSVTVGYARGATMSYSLNAFSPWEGYRVAFNGTEGRIELDVVERSWVRSAADQHVDSTAVVDPSAAEARDESADGSVRPPGERVLVQRHWEPAREVAIPTGGGAHGGGDAMLLDDLFRGVRNDPLRRAAGYLDGVRSVAVGICANTSLAEGRVVETAELGVDLEPDPTNAVAR